MAKQCLSLFGNFVPNRSSRMKKKKYFVCSNRFPFLSNYWVIIGRVHFSPLDFFLPHNVGKEWEKVHFKMTCSLFSCWFLREIGKHISSARPKEIKKPSILLLISPSPRNEEGEKVFFLLSHYLRFPILSVPLSEDIFFGHGKGKRGKEEMGKWQITSCFPCYYKLNHATKKKKKERGKFIISPLQTRDVLHWAKNKLIARDLFLSSANIQTLVISHFISQKIQVSVFYHAQV